MCELLSCVQLLGPQGLYPARLLCPWDSPVQNTGAGSHALLQGIFSTQGLNPDVLHCRQILYCLSHQGSPGDKWITVKWLRGAQTGVAVSASTQAPPSLVSLHLVNRVMPLGIRALIELLSCLV